MQDNSDDILFCFLLAVTGLNDPRTLSIDPTTGNLYIAQSIMPDPGYLAQVVLVRQKTWTLLTSHPLLTHTPTPLPTGQPTRQPTRQPTGDVIP